MTRILETRRLLSVLAVPILMCGGLLGPQLLARGRPQSGPRPNFRGAWAQTSWVHSWRQGEVNGTVDVGVGPLGMSVTLEQTDTTLTVNRTLRVTRNTGPAEDVVVRQVFPLDGTSRAGQGDDACFTRQGSWREDTFVGESRRSDPSVGLSCGPRPTTTITLTLNADGSLAAAETSSSNMPRVWTPGPSGPVMTKATYRRRAAGTR